MEKKDAIVIMTEQARTLEALPSIAGRVPAINAIRGRIRFCNAYKVTEKELDLFVKEGAKEIERFNAIFQPKSEAGETKEKEAR
jgi:hypothetical protein